VWVLALGLESRQLESRPKGMRKIGSSSVCRVGEPILSRPAGWRRSPSLRWKRNPTPIDTAACPYNTAVCSGLHFRSPPTLSPSRGESFLLYPSPQCVCTQLHQNPYRIHVPLHYRAVRTVRTTDHAHSTHALFGTGADVRAQRVAKKQADELQRALATAAGGAPPRGFQAAFSNPC
jgi:hypothetical protein